MTDTEAYNQKYDEYLSEEEYEWAYHGIKKIKVVNMIDIQSDSRKIKPGDTFIAVKCEVNDGHKYIDTAIKAGAKKIIAERGEYSVPTEIVPNTRKYLEDYLKNNYNKYLEEMTIIGITGTNGKTTSAYLFISGFE